MDTLITSALQSVKTVLIILIPFLFLAALLAILFAIKRHKKNCYAPRDLLTPTELKFFRQLEPQAEKQNLFIFAKVRLADLANPTATKYTSNWQTAFNKIQSKHFDFVLCDKTTLKIKYIVELDDRSHNRPDSKEKDNFKNIVAKQCGYQMLRTTAAQQFTLPIPQNIPQTTP